MKTIQDIFLTPRITEYRMNKNGVLQFRARRLKLLPFFALSILLGVISFVVGTIVFSSIGYEIGMAVTGSLSLFIMIFAFAFAVCVIADCLYFGVQRIKFNK